MQLLLDFERKTSLGPTKAAQLLGVAYGTYCQYKRGDRVLPNYVKAHIETIMDLPEWVLNNLIRKRNYGSES